MGLQVVGIYLQAMEAEAVCAALRSAGLQAQMLDREIGINIPYYTQGLRVAVPADELETALAVLASLKPAPLSDEDAIKPRTYQKGWIVEVLLLVLAAGGLWGLRELVWWAFFEPQGAGGEIAARMWAAIVLIGLSAPLYFIASRQLHGRSGRAFPFWLAGFVAALTADSLAVWETVTWQAAHPDPQSDLTAWEFVNQYYVGHLAVLALGVAVWWIERRDRAEAATA